MSFDWTSVEAITGFVASISTAVWGIFQYVGKKKAQDIENRRSKIENADLVNKLYNNILEDIKTGQEFTTDMFKHQVEFCEEEFENFVKFVKNKKNG